MVPRQGNPTLEDRLSELERRVHSLEILLRPGGFRRHCIDLELDCTGVIREWFKYHELVHPKILGLEMDGYYTQAALRMAIFRMASTNELIKVGWGTYRYNRLASTIQVRKSYNTVSPETLAKIRQDTTHSHAELARLLGVNVNTVRRAGHQSPYKFSGVQQHVH